MVLKTISPGCEVWVIYDGVFSFSVLKSLVNKCDSFVWITNVSMRPGVFCQDDQSSLHILKI